MLKKNNVKLWLALMLYYTVSVKQNFEWFFKRLEA